MVAKITEFMKEIFFVLPYNFLHETLFKFLSDKTPSVIFVFVHNLSGHLCAIGSTQMSGYLKKDSKSGFKNETCGQLVLIQLKLFCFIIP